MISLRSFTVPFLFLLNPLPLPLCPLPRKKLNWAKSEALKLCCGEYLEAVHVCTGAQFPPVTSSCLLLMTIKDLFPLRPLSQGAWGPERSSRTVVLYGASCVFLYFFLLKKLISHTTLRQNCVSRSSSGCQCYQYTVYQLCNKLN